MSAIVNQTKRAFKNLFKEFDCVVRRLDELCGQEVRLDELERELLPLVLKLAKAGLQDFIQDAGDGDVGETFNSKGVELYRMEEKHVKTYRSLFGVIDIERYVYALRKRQKAVSPLDQKLGLPEDETSYVLEDWMGSLAVHLPYDTAAELLQKMFGVSRSTTIENRVAKMAEHAESFREEMAEELPDKEGDALIALADAKGVPIRTPWEEVVERELKRKPHVRHHKNTEPRSTRRRRRGDQVKSQQAVIGACYSVDRVVRDTQHFLDKERAGDDSSQQPTFSPANKRLWAEMNRVVDGRESRGAERIFQQLAAHIAERDPQGKQDLVCIMDGARSLWLLQREYLPDATPIIDIFHVTEKLWAVAHCFEPEGSKAAEDRVTHYLRMMLDGKVDSVRGLFQRFLNQKEWHKSKREALQNAINYLKKNRDAMQYHRYLAKGYPIGSGAVEGACKHVIGDRLCHSGMRWELAGAQDVLHLRTIRLNSQWDRFIEHRIQKEQASLYNASTAA